MLAAPSTMSCGFAGGDACLRAGVGCPVASQGTPTRDGLPPVAPAVQRVRSGGAPGSRTVRARTSSNGWCSSPRLEKHKPHNTDDAITWPTGELNPRVVPGQAVRKYGFEFTWTSRHRTGADLDPYRYVGDELADKVLQSVSHPLWRLRTLYIACLTGRCGVAQVAIPAGSDSLEVIRAAASDSNHPCHAAAQALLDQCTTDPSWLDRDSVARGQDMFVRYGFGSLAMLFFFSLVGGFGAPRINKGTLHNGRLATRRSV